MPSNSLRQGVNGAGRGLIAAGLGAVPGRWSGLIRRLGCRRSIPAARLMRGAAPCAVPPAWQSLSSGPNRPLALPPASASCRLSRRRAWRAPVAQGSGWQVAAALPGP